MYEMRPYNGRRNIILSCKDSVFSRGVHGVKIPVITHMSFENGQAMPPFALKYKAGGSHEIKE